ncbi:MAG: mannonate dehydratase, partial [Halobacteriales archaeon]
MAQSPREADRSRTEGESVSVGFRTRLFTDERLRFMAQVGVEDVFVDAIAPGFEADAYPDEVDVDGDRYLELAPDAIPSVERLREIDDLLAEFNLRFAGVHSLHYGMYGDIMFDREGRETQTEGIATLLRNLGEAGIPTLGYQWNPRGVVPMRTETEAEVRGGAKATAWDEADLGEIETPPGELERAYTEAECWEHYEGFLGEILP